MTLSKKYAVSDAQIAAVAATAKTMAIVTATAAIRPAVYDYIVGASGTPADNVMTYALQRFTVAGTTTAKTPNPMDSADAAAVAVCGVDASIEPTKTAATTNVVIPANQRASFRWVSAPDGEFRAPATAANGIAATVLSAAYTGVAACTVHFME